MKRFLAFPIVTSMVLSAHAAFLMPDLPGSTSYDGWDNLNSVFYPSSQYGGGFPGAQPWLHSIPANQPGSGDATFVKDSGHGYTATTSVYAPVALEGEDYSGIFSTSDTSVIEGVETIVFQLLIGEGDAAVVDAPVLSFNGGSQNIAATFFKVLDVENGGESPVGGEFNIYTLAWQWNLTSINDEISSFNIAWSVGAHSQTYALQLDQGSVFSQVIPEPGTGILLGLAFLLLGHFAFRCSTKVLPRT